MKQEKRPTGEAGTRQQSQGQAGQRQQGRDPGSMAPGPQRQPQQERPSNERPRYPTETERESVPRQDAMRDRARHGDKD